METNDSIDRIAEELNDIVPDNSNIPYNIKDVIFTIADEGEFLEVHRNYAKNIVVGYCRLGGMSVGIVANQPNYLAGVLDCDASRKAARFVQMCDAFNIPILTLVDVPGFLPGSGQEYAGIIIHGAKLMFAYGEATVPKVTVTLRKSYGGAHDVMSCKQLRGDFNYAWPSAEIAVMGAKGAIEVLESKKIAKIEDENEKAEFISKKVSAYEEAFANPYQAASYGYIDDVIEPRNTRFRVIRAFQTLQTKKLVNPPKKHSNIPL
jgi:acetyl-CoA carboxylase carboxyltransferase component